MSQNANDKLFVDLGLLDLQFDRDFDDLTLTASELIGAPTSLLSIMDDANERQFFKSHHGLGEPWASLRATPLSHSFCRHVRDRNAPVVINDARTDSLFHDNPAVTDLTVIAYMGVPVHDPAGRPLGALCVIEPQARVWTDTDLQRLTRLANTASDLLHMRATMRESELARRDLARARSDADRFSRIIERSSNEVYVFDGVTLRFLHVNKGACENLQFSLDEMRCRTPLDVKPEMTAESFATLIGPLNDGTRDTLVFETVHQRKDGTLYPCEIRLECDCTATARVFVAFCQDLTERHALIRTLERRRREADGATRAKSTFLANISHEIRTPLNGVLGMAEVLSSTPLEPDQQQMLSTIATAGGQLLTLINDILDLSKMEADMFSLHHAPFVPARVMFDTCALFKGLAAARDLRFTVDVGRDLHETWTGSDTRIRQIITNLIGNALKFTRAGSIAVLGELLFEAEEQDEAVLRISVKDTGPGVPDAMKTLIFERFQQGHHGDDDIVGGAGLGLTIARALCLQHGGDLRVTDTPGGGATFIATLRVLRVAEAARPARAAPNTALEDLRNLPHPLRLLIAEDNATNRLILAAMLKSAPIQLTVVDNGLKALAALKAGGVDAALLDIQMPGMAGDQVARALRLHETETGCSPIPLISWTASVSAEQMRAYAMAGFDTSLPKPTSGADLARTIRWISEKLATPA